MSSSVFLAICNQCEQFHLNSNLHGMRMADEDELLARGQVDWHTEHLVCQLRVAN